MTVVCINCFLKLLVFGVLNEFVIPEFIVKNISSWVIFTDVIIYLLFILFIVISKCIICYIPLWFFLLDPHNLLKNMTSIDLLLLANFILEYSIGVYIFFLVIALSCIIDIGQTYFLMLICTFYVFHFLIEWVNILINFNR